MNTEDLQFYPTTPELVLRAWGKFKNTSYTRVLEPSAGKGDLLSHLYDRYNTRRNISVDVVEINSLYHPILREKGCNIVGLDFLQMGSGAHYSHIIMNPPFNQGSQHLLHAWDILWSGEIVAILNANTIRNPHTKERLRLERLINLYGEVEFVNETFVNFDTGHHATLDVALVYLRKKSGASFSVGAAISSLSVDKFSSGDMVQIVAATTSLAVAKPLIERQVALFNRAVEEMKVAVVADHKASQFKVALGYTMVESMEERFDMQEKSMQKDISERYIDLKDRAWNSILRWSEVSDRLSHNTRSEFVAQFDSIKALEFTSENIYNFLLGLVKSNGAIQTSVLCDVFDLITKYHSDNICFYQGWKSNDKHRTLGMKIKGTRFVLPYFKNQGWNNPHIGHQDKQRLVDIDKCFLILDSKQTTDGSLENLFTSLDSLKLLFNGERVEGEYFSVRWYPKKGTIHFFPKRKDLIERLNRLVGRERAWLPPVDENVGDKYWEHYANSEKNDSRVKQTLKKKHDVYSNPLNKIFSSDEDDYRSGVSMISGVLAHVHNQLERDK